MQNYSKIQKFFHDFVLRTKFINKSLFEIEKIFFLKNKNIEKEPHIFITSLPRSGTTSLLNFIYSSNNYASLIYKNMPFVLSPNISKYLNKKDILKKERLHADGIKFDNNSPEALDEIFFNNGEIFIKKELINYIQLILHSENKTKYLSKNNLNYNRIDLINSILPNSFFLIPIREPLQHANSLLNQHLHFTKLQKKDDFVRRYMNYLSHHEFGINHKSWNTPINFNNFNDINYWIEQWQLFYEDIFNRYQSYDNCVFVIYEQLTNPNYIQKILKRINLNSNKINSKYFKNSNKRKINLKYDKENYKKAKIIFNSFFS